MLDYPAMLQLEGKRVVIVGGGKIGLRKAQGFAGTGAEVIVISPEIVERFNELTFITWEKKYFEPEDIKEAHLIFAATDDKEVNRLVKACANDFQWVDVVSEQSESSFHVPAVVRRGKLTLTVSTSGASPVLAKEIKQQLAKQYDERYASIVEEYKAKRKQEKA
ncbi:NAD(P)-dependent oxidoreductase [Priestia taiwanensis]|uniref:precorrin-2 dehydrogenase n=1 Tax=Priestia taiwanensis TaxID=1347902 RepID=A0A917EM17_9BACI|nr:NAD(P)-dependent oxidoreductase [Priestia taiwanensis]MBM7361491.1 precorrin-2 dehydrogenase/sirohydrochlorin ferrochelatase [Priestia taiwanensis]GGE54605.1 precorrin-2 dehydrogenase [Priestia taiwanensis]